MSRQRCMVIRSLAGVEGPSRERAARHRFSAASRNTCWLNRRPFLPVCLALALIASCLGSSLATAQNNTTWTGAEGDLWSNATFWSAGVPTSSTNAILDNGAAAVVNVLGQQSSYLFLGNATGTAGNLSIVTGGNLAVTSGAHIGYLGNGTLSITGGGQLSSLTGNIAWDSSSTATVTVAGNGSSWINTGTLAIGGNGTGFLTITNGGQVSDASGFVARDAGSSGSVTVDGAASSWTNTSALYVGNYGSGTLTISNGGLLTTSSTTNYSSIGRYSGSTGSVTVTGNGSTWQNSDDLYVGYSGAGALTVSAGGNVTNAYGYIGRYSGSTGQVVVTGTGSRWINADSLHVGYEGSGQLSVLNGGVVSSVSHGYVGRASTSTSSAVVDGAGSRWTSAASILVGFYGNGTVQVTNGGYVSAVDTFVGTYSGSSGSVTVSGNDSTWITTGNLAIGGNNTAAGGTGTVNVNDNGRLSVAGNLTLWQSDSSLTVNGGNVAVAGNLASNGQVQITGGGQVTNAIGYIGHNATASGSVTVDGAGSLWGNSQDLFVGYNGTGALTVSAGGNVTNAYGYIGRYSGSTGQVVVTGTGSRWINADSLHVGYEGSGQLSVLNGGVVSSVSHGYVGRASTSTSSAVVDGAGSRWTSAASILVGFYGNGTVQVTNGGYVSAVDTFVGTYSGSSGSVTVSGNDSTWITTGNLAIGGNNTAAGGAGTVNVNDHGLVSVAGNLTLWQASSTLAVSGGNMAVTGSLVSNGQMTITNAGQVSNSYAYLGNTTGATGSVSVDGAGSKWTNSSNLHVGYNGNGTLSITNGGQLSSLTGNIAWGSNSTGTVTVAGNGSSWINTGTLAIGGNGTGYLNITNGAQVSNASGYIGRDAGSSGSVTVDGSGSIWDNSSNVSVGEYGSGTLLVTNGGQVVSDLNSYVGHQNGGTGTATIRGTGSSWSSADNLTVGYYGIGTLAIAEGGQVSNENGFVGYASGASGEVIVDGAGSVWTNTYGVSIGHDGTGTLTIRNGGQVFSAANPGYGYVGRVAGSTGTVTITGNGSTWTNSNNLYIGGNATTAGGAGTVNVNDNSRLSVTGNLTLWQANSSLSVNGGNVAVTGNLVSNGQVQIAGGAQVSNTHSSIGYASGSVGSVTVNGAGSLWDNSQDLFVGNAGNGTLTITNSAQVHSTRGNIGYSSGSVGSVTVDGAGSTWTNQLNISVGQSGNGTLIISNGGQVSNNRTYVAATTASTGNVTVTGAGSTWTMDAYLTVGRYGNGSLAITNGGQVLSTESGIVGPYASGTGSVLISGAGSSWTTGAFYIGGNDTLSGGAGTVNVNDDGVLKVAGDLILWQANNTLNVSGGNVTLTGALFNNGQVSVTNGGRLSNSYGYLGNTTGSAASMVVDGVGSAWNMTGALVVGRYGNSTLSIANSAQVTNAAGYVAYYNGTHGTATVTGSGSTWTAASLYLGGNSTASNGGVGAVTVSNAGRLNVAGNLRLWDSDDTLTVNGGNVSAGVLLGNGSIFLSDPAGGAAALTIGSNNSGTFYGNITNGATAGSLAKVGAGTQIFTGTMNLTGNEALTVSAGQVQFASHATANAARVTVGSGADSAALSILDGATLSSQLASYVGRNSGSSGNVTVDGSGSAWSNSSNLYVGYAGAGVLAITNGAQVSDSYGYLGNNTASSGNALVDGPGSQWLNDNNLYVGRSGTGALTVANAALVTAHQVWIGRYAGGSGVITVNGSNSTLTTESSIFVGGSGNGTINVTNGGQIHSGSSFHMGRYAGSTGTANVDGAGSLWTAVYNVSVGYDGDAQLAITNGGHVANKFGWIGYNSGSAGNVLVDGPDSAWTVSSTFTAGRYGNATLLIGNGGSVSAQGNMYVAAQTGSTANVTVTGVNSTWSTAANLYIGGNETTAGGNGMVNIVNGASLSVAGALKVWETGSLNVQGGSLSTGALVGDGAVYIGGSSGGAGLTLGSDIDSTFSGTIADGSSPASLLKVGSGTQTLSGNNTYSGGTTVQAGSLLAANTQGSATGLGDVDVAGGATIGGNGTIGASGTTVTIQNNGTLAPGLSPGTLHVAGNLDLELGAILAFELNDPLSTTLASDKLVVASTLSTEPGVLMDVALQNGYTPEYGDQWTVVEYANFSGNVSDITVRSTLSDPDLSYSLAVSGNSLVLNVVPEPATIAAIGSGILALAGLCWYRRRRRQDADEPEPEPFFQD